MRRVMVCGALIALIVAACSTDRTSVENQTKDAVEVCAQNDESATARAVSVCGANPPPVLQSSVQACTIRGRAGLLSGHRYQFTCGAQS